MELSPAVTVALDVGERAADKPRVTRSMRDMIDRLGAPSLLCEIQNEWHADGLDFTAALQRAKAVLGSENMAVEFMLGDVLRPPRQAAGGVTDAGRYLVVAAIFLFYPLIATYGRLEGVLEAYNERRERGRAREDEAVAADLRDLRNMRSKNILDAAQAWHATCLQRAAAKWHAKFGTPENRHHIPWMGGAKPPPVTNPPAAPKPRAATKPRADTKPRAATKPQAAPKLA